MDLPIGVRLEKRDAVYAVARSTPARWLEEYFLVRSPNQPDIQRDGWTEEENATIRAWKWWRVEEMRDSLLPVQAGMAAGSFERVPT